jgi:hypothetical protein
MNRFEALTRRTGWQRLPSCAIAQFLNALLCLCACAQYLHAQASPAPQNALHIVVQKREGASARLMSEKHVFQRGDQVRLRVSSEADGYLYVLNRSSSGTMSVLFPGQDTASTRIQRGHEYTLPASSQRWFTITDPPGYETLYFLVSSEPTPRASTGTVMNPPLVKPPKKAPDAAEGLVPRCNDEMFRSRGDCLDLTAGPQAVDAADALPEAMNAMSGTASRDINISEEGQTVTVTPAKGAGPAVIYEFRIAHR